MGSVCCSQSPDEEKDRWAHPSPLTLISPHPPVIVKHRLVGRELGDDRKADKAIKKLLLLGAGESAFETFATSSPTHTPPPLINARKKTTQKPKGSSGKTTFFKQLKVIHGDGFSQKDKLDYAAQIENQIIEQMQKLLARAREMQEDYPGKHENLSVCGKQRTVANMKNKHKRIYIAADTWRRAIITIHWIVKKG